MLEKELDKLRNIINLEFKNIDLDIEEIDLQIDKHLIEIQELELKKSKLQMKKNEISHSTSKEIVEITKDYIGFDHDTLNDTIYEIKRKK
nr:hypothetical protein GTC16762_32850 [Pigmentibacter ruber]